jgi:ribosomal protein L11 methyltransferase
VSDLVQLSFSIPSAAADAVANLLTEQGGGLELRDSDTLGAPGEGRTELLIWVPASTVARRVQQVETLMESLRLMDAEVDPWSWESQEIAPEDWQETYKKYFKVNRLGRFIVVKPSWEDYLPQAHDRVVELDPGMAFGTGLHASTVLVVRAMERRAPPPQRVLDLGTGTGLLALAAARLWPSTRILAVDNDELAVEICSQNVARNNLEKRITAEHLSAMDVKGSFNLVLANLNRPLLVELQPRLGQLLADYGRLIISGMLSVEAQQVTTLVARDLTIEPEFSEEEDGWRAVMFRVRSQ